MLYVQIMIELVESVHLLHFVYFYWFSHLYLSNSLHVHIIYTYKIHTYTFYVLPGTTKKEKEQCSITKDKDLI
jgi:hypothetical protein